MTTQEALASTRSRYHGQRMSEAEYLALPDEKPYLEYVDGVVLQKPMPTRGHGWLAGRLIFQFGLYAQTAGGNYGPEIRMRLPSSGNYRLPDTAYWSAARVAARDPLPTLAVGVRSPGQSISELRRKCRAFREAGVDACWIIDPIRKIAEVFEGERDRALVPGDGVLECASMPGFRVHLADLFSNLEP